MPNFVFIAAGQKLAELGYRFRDTLAFPSSFTVVETRMEDAVDYCRHKLPEGTDAIIARGNTANMLRAARIPVPIVTLPIKDSDLIRSVTMAAALYPGEESRIAYIGLEDVIQSVSEFLKMIHREIRFYRIDDSRDIQNCIRRAKQEQIKVVIGGEYTKELAEAQGLRCVLLESTEGSLKEAYERAQEIRKGVLLQKKKLREKLILMNAISDGIVGINEKGRISLFNQSAKTLFSRKEAEVMGKAASVLFADEELGIINRTLLRGDEILAHPATFSNREWLLDFRPVMIHGQSKGIIIRIHAEANSNSGFPQKDGNFPRTSGDFKYPDAFSGKSPAFLSACALSARFASSSLPVLIFGESGTGKTSFSYQMHRQSLRKAGVFLVREGALLTPEDLMAANGGSLCIHDVDTLQIAMVPVLNQYLEQGVVSLPDQSFRQLDVRIFATATLPFSGDNQDSLNASGCKQDSRSDFQPTLQQENRTDFSPDSHPSHPLISHLGSRLYYNLDALTLKIPALRERPEDTWLLFSSMLTTCCPASTGTAVPPLWEDAAAKLLSGYSWPGNIRELKSIVRRFALMASESENAEENLHILQQCLTWAPSSASQNDTVSDTAVSANARIFLPTAAKNAPAEPSAGAFSSDKNFVIHGRLVSWDELKALDRYYQGHRGVLAKQLGVSRSTLWRYFKEMEADRPS